MIAPLPKQDVHHLPAGPCTWSEALFNFFCTGKAAVYGLHARPFCRAIIEALPSTCQALAFEGFPTRANVCSSPATRAGKSPVTSLAHETCMACRAGPPERVVPGARSARSANGTRGAQHVMPHTRARMGTPVCRIQAVITLSHYHHF